MADNVARCAVRHRRAVLAATLLFVALAFVLGSGVVKRLSGAGFADPAAASTKAARSLDVDFRNGEPNFILLVRADQNVDAARAAAAGTALSERIARLPDVQIAVSYWTAGKPAVLRSSDGREALILVRLEGGDDHATKVARLLAHQLSGRDGPLTVRAGGESVIYAAVGDRIQADLSRAELIVFPVTFVLLILVFGGIIAALLPLAVGGISIVGTLLVLRIITSFTDVSVYALNLTTGLGLGLAIDYSLFVVTRYREELAKGTAYDDAIVASVRTAGRTVVFSAATVALSLAALLVFPLFFLRSFGYAGIAVVVIAAIGATVVLPALLALLGPRIDALTLFRRRPADATHGFWQRTAQAVMRRPIVSGAAVVVLLVVLGLPFLDARFGLPDDRVLPRSNVTQQVQQSLRDDFAGRSGQPVSVVAPGGHATTAAIGDYARRLSSIPGADLVQSSAGTFSHGQEVVRPGGATFRFANSAGFWLQITPSVEPYSDAGKRLVHDVRSTPAPTQVVVGGMAAELVDTEHSLGARLPLALAIIAAAMIAVLFLFTGSVVVPLKALMLNLLSLTATFGAMVWIFQEGHLSWLVGHPIVTGTLDTTTPILMFCVAFGLSMDYEVFLLSRIKETYDVTRDNTTAVAVGLERTGRLVTAAAALIAVVWIAFISSAVTFIKLLGLGMALAVIVDATLVRGVLVPAFMRLAGDWNWWAPAPLRRLHQRIRVAHEPAATSSYSSENVTALRDEEHV